MALIPFVQLEFAGALGLPDGRYLSREEEGDRVLIVQLFGAPKPPGRLAPRTRPVEPEDEDTVPVTRLTVAFPERFTGERDAKRWLEGVAGDAQERAAAVRSATLLVNRQDGIWVDIRDLASYRKGHIAGAHHIPLSQIESGTPTLLEKHQATPIILVCTTGQTAQRAASLLHKQGFTALHVLRGGMSDWQGANLPLAKG